MPIFPKLFGSPKERESKKIFDELLLKAERKYKPMADVGWAIGRASNNCRDAFKGLIQATTEQERASREMGILGEFICFYMYLTLLHAARQLTESQFEKLQNFLGQSISTATVNSYCAHWPNDKKENFIEVFYKMLNERELEYKELLHREYYQFNTSKESQTLDASTAALISVFMRLGLNVSPLITNAEKDVATIKSVARVAMAEWDRMELDKLITEVKKAS